MLIPKTLLICIQNERGIKCVPIVKKKRGSKSFWDNMTPKQRKIFLAKRGKKISKALKKMSPEQLRKRTEKATLANQALFYNPLTKEKRLESARKVTAGWNKKMEEKRKEKNESIVYKDTERINGYAGVITPSQMKELINA